MSRALQKTVNGPWLKEAWDDARDDAEQREGPRVTLLIRTAKIVGSTGEYLCILRDVSEGGVKARVFHDLPQNERLAIELASGERWPIEPVWQNGDIAGFRFTDPVSLDRLLADAPAGRSKRSVRLRLALPAFLTGGGRRIPAELRDISQHGASLQCDEHLAIDERFGLECEGMPQLHVRVRWRRRPSYGLVFEQTFRVDELARIVGSLGRLNEDRAVSAKVRAPALSST